MHTNTVNNKKYIGITCKKPECRWNEGKGYKHNRYFWNAIQKYGWDNFDHEIVSFNLSHDDACKMEKDLIAYYDSNNSTYGYNLTSGGDSGFLHTEETKERIREANSGINNAMYGISPKDRMDDETYKKWLYKQQTNKPHGKDNPQYGVSPKERMDEKTYKEWLYKQKTNKPTGKDHPMYGVSMKDRTDEDTYKQWREKMYDSPKNISVKCIETDKIYKSAREAERETGIAHSSIMKSCMSEDHSAIAGGFHWCLSSDNFSMEDLGLEYKGKRYIRCIETSRIYKTAREVKRETGLDDSSINKCCKGYQFKTVGGLHWEYIYLLPGQYEEWCKENNLTIQN